MMTVAEYKSFYLDLLLGILGGNPAHFQITMPDDAQKKGAYDNYRSGLRALALISLIESNFLSKESLRELRNFRPDSSLPSSINQTHLSAFLYLRDCFAHNPYAKLLQGGTNTSSFLRVLENGGFPYATVSGQDVAVEDTLELHRIVLRFYGENV